MRVVRRRFATGSGNTLWLCTYNIAGNTQRFFLLPGQCATDAFALGFTIASFGIVSGDSGGLRTDSCRGF